MNINEKIRRIRESKEWSQEQMAEKLNMSLNGYAKIERLKLALSHSQESLVLNKRLLSEKEELFNKLIEQKDNEIDALKEVITLLKNK
ncbi:helix-turn-helix domain-containing protein [Bisgaard Taxon 10/6]|uniref:Helix-turn-helix domain-containing protein n=1 Tax=Exercitatus varius TaxID=67857 RepID=A0ABT6ETV7_9PAST|nr:helix-turn-helix domain-containing protein [Exercitatus varius]MDG2946910.1 helix-turn-helix domain-containing protein [Exercitatus varius]